MKLSRRRLLSIGTILALEGCASTKDVSSLQSKSLIKSAADIAGENRLSQDFKILSQNLSWLADTRKAVGWVYRFDKRLFGSAVLLDDQGTLALCNHEFSGNLCVSFPFQNDQSVIYDQQHFDPALAAANQGFSAPMNIDCLYTDPQVDVAFGRIPAEMVQAYGLKPIEWSRSTPLGNDIQTIFVGFGGLSGILSADYGNSITQVPPFTTKERKIPTICNDETNTDIIPGDSGGGIFDATNGRLVGIIKAIESINLGHNETEPECLFTPIEILWSRYQSQFPELAKRTQTKMGFVPNAPNSSTCILVRPDMTPFFIPTALRP